MDFCKSYCDMFSTVQRLLGNQIENNKRLISENQGLKYERIDLMLRLRTNK